MSSLSHARLKSSREMPEVELPGLLGAIAQLLELIYELLVLLPLRLEHCGVGDASVKGHLHGSAPHAEGMG